MSARRPSRAGRRGSTRRWYELEEAAVAGQPLIAQVRSAPARRLRPAGTSRWHLLYAIPAVLVYLFCYTAPIWGLAAVSDNRFQNYRQDPEQTIPLAGTFFIVALVLLVVSLVHWLVVDRPPNGFYEVQAGLAMVLGAVSSGIIMIKGTRAEVDLWQVWVTPAVAATVVGAVFLLLLFLGRRSYPNRSAGRVELPPPGGGLRSVVVQMTDLERAEARRRRDAAIDEWARLGVITPDEAARAREAELGGLAVHMA